MKDSKNIWVWVGVAVVAAVIAVWLAWKPAANSPAAGPTGAVNVPVYAPQGQLTPNFPKELILDPQAQVESSYSINYDTSTNQYTAQWNSSSSLLSLYNKYKTYFGGNGWAITNSSGATGVSMIGVIYATNASANVNMTVLKQGSGAGVTISYVSH
jgi:hypothetical protein